MKKFKLYCRSLQKIKMNSKSSMNNQKSKKMIVKAFGVNEKRRDKKFLKKNTLSKEQYTKTIQSYLQMD